MGKILSTLLIVGVIFAYAMIYFIVPTVKLYWEGRTTGPFEPDTGYTILLIVVFCGVCLAGLIAIAKAVFNNNS